MFSSRRSIVSGLIFKCSILLIFVYGVRKCYNFILYVFVQFSQHCLAALFTIAKMWKQPRYPSSGEWLKNVQFFLLLDLENIMLGEISQTMTDTI